MVVIRKAALSLLISILLFAVFTVFAFTGLFDLVDARFYNPAVARALGREIDADTQVIADFFEELRISFAATLDEGAVRRSLLADLESEDIARRASLYGKLLESLGGLQSVRFIDSGGRRIHFSTWQPDILRQDLNSIAYRNYDAVENSAAYIPYGQVEATVPKLILDGAGERIVFSHPFYDSYDVYQGTALFSVSVRAVMDRMASVGRIKVGEDISVVSQPPGLIIGLPPVGRNVLRPLITRIWSENSLSLGRLNSDLTGVNLALISRRMDQNIFIGRLVNESLLSFPLAMRVILLISFLITVFLIIFLVFNIRQDDVTILQSRLKKLQVNLFEEYYEHAGDLNWSHWKRELEHRREELHSELKRGLSAKTGSLPEIDNFIDRSWEELMAILGGHIEGRSEINEDTLRALLSRLPETTLAPSPSPRTLDQTGAEATGEAEALDEADIVEALEGPPDRKVMSPAPDPEFEELEELETGELELAELEIVEPEELKAEEPETVELEIVEPEELEAEEPEPVELEIVEPVELEAEEPEPVELEIVEPVELEAAEPAGESPDAIANAPGIAPSEFENSNASKMTPDNLARAVEFSPEPQEVEQEKEAAARSMAESFEIQSPFDSILSSLSELGPDAETPEAAEPELPEFEAVDLGPIELDDQEPETLTDDQGIEPLIFEDSDAPKMALGNLASDIEFSPNPQALEREKEEAARSMAEQFEIQSPFVSIFSSLSEVEFEPEPMEELESLESELRAPDNSREAVAEELRLGFAGPQLSVPFLKTLSSEIAFLAVADEDEPVTPEETEAVEPEMAEAPETAEADGVVTERDGVIYINESVLRPDKETLKGLDKNFKNLIDSILDNT